VRGRSDTWVIFSEELRVHLRSRWYPIFTLAIVVAFVIAMVVVPAVQGGKTTGASPSSTQALQRVGIMDESGLFPDLGGQAGPVRFDSQDAGLAAVARGTIDSFYVIPRDYLQSGNVEQYAKFPGRFPSSPGGEALVRGLLVQGLITGRVDQAVTNRILAPALFENMRVEPDGSTAQLSPTAVEVGGLLIPLLFGALLGMGLVAGFSYMVQSVSEEKESRLVEVVITSASPLSIMGGKLFALGAIGLAQAAVWIVTAALTVPPMLAHVSGASALSISAGLWVTIIFCFITGYLLMTTLAIFIGAIAPSSREAGRLGGWIPVLAFVPYWFSGLVLVHPDGLGARLLAYIPFFAPTGLLVRISGGGSIAGWKIAAALAGVAATSAVVLWVSTRVFRAAILMRGQNFTRHNLWVALRDAD
jgi:ABC-2 type transport system permease protein